MRKRFQSLSPSMIVALTALVVAMSGVAVAADKIGGRDIKANAIKTAKIKDGAVTTTKIRDAAVTASKLAPGAIPSTSLGDNSVTTTKIADGAVTTSKLDPSERADGFEAKHVNVNMPATQDTVVIQVALPTPGNYLMTAMAQMGNNTATAQNIHCNLLDANNPVASTDVPTDATATFQGSVSLSGFSDGGIVRLSCNPDLAPGTARNISFTAVRVSSVTDLPAAP